MRYANFGQHLISALHHSLSAHLYAERLGILASRRTSRATYYGVDKHIMHSNSYGLGGAKTLRRTGARMAQKSLITSQITVILALCKPLKNGKKGAIGASAIYSVNQSSRV